MPLAQKPPKGKGLAAALEYVKAVGMAVYMGADHFVWAGQAGVIKDKDLAGNMQKLSLWGWFAASCASLIMQTNALTKALDDMTAAGNDEDDKKAAAVRVQKIMMDIVTNSTQGVLALALLEKIPLDKRKTGALGIFLSALNCYNLAPPLALKRKTE